jgi:hypothetical protein
VCVCVCVRERERPVGVSIAGKGEGDHVILGRFESIDHQRQRLPLAHAVCIGNDEPVGSSCQEMWLCCGRKLRTFVGDEHKIEAFLVQILIS